MNTIKIEIGIIIFSVLLLSGFAVRADLETKMQSQKSKISDLKKQVNFKVQEIVRLKELLKPLEYAQPLDQIRISSATGVRRNPLGGSIEAMHGGLDLLGEIGDPVYTVLAGVVVEHYVPPDGGKWKGHPILGGMLTIKHEEGLFSVYGHLSETFINEGDFVEMGQKIGEVGNTGYSTGPHLHWAFIVDGFKYLKERR